MLKRSIGRPVKFIGELIAQVETSPERVRGDYSGMPGRWQEVELYKTDKDKFVISIFDGTQWQGESSNTEVAVLKDENELIDYIQDGLGFTKLVQELFDDAGIEYSENI